MDEIKPLVAWVKAQKPYLGLPGKPAGWIIVDNTTGNRIGLDTRYPSREEAEARIPAEVEALKARRRAAQEREAAQHAATGPTVEAVTNPAVTPVRRYRTVSNGTYGVGRRYYDEPGCTYYDDGSGRYRIQIWG